MFINLLNDLPGFIWGGPCEDAFNWVASNHPVLMAAWVLYGDMPPHALTFAAEALGKIEDSELVMKVLEPLLDHPDAVVREGVLYGLSGHYNNKPEVGRKIGLMAKNDLSAGVRHAAKDEYDYWIIDHPHEQE